MDCRQARMFINCAHPQEQCGALSFRCWASEFSAVSNKNKGATWRLFVAGDRAWLSRSSMCTHHRTPFQWWCRVQNKCEGKRQLGFNAVGAPRPIQSPRLCLQASGELPPKSSTSMSPLTSMSGVQTVEIGDGEGGFDAFFAGDWLFATGEGQALNQARGENRSSCCSFQGVK